MGEFGVNIKNEQSFCFVMLRCSSIPKKASETNFVSTGAQPISFKMLISKLCGEKNERYKLMG